MQHFTLRGHYLTQPTGMVPGVMALVRRGDGRFVTSLGDLVRPCASKLLADLVIVEQIEGTPRTFLATTSECEKAGLCLDGTTFVPVLEHLREG